MYKNAAFVLVALLSVSGASALHGEDVDFQRDIRPLLSDRCFKCHGFDDESREAELGLHLFAEATRDLGGYKAVNPGHSTESEMVARLLSDDPDEVMPPASANKPKFSPAEVDLIKKWIDEGAKYERHWAFEKPIRSPLPEPDGMKQPVDQLLDVAIEKAGLISTEKANPFTLIRRLSFDLRGIPPTVAETDVFATAYEKNPEAAWLRLVDSFLGSPAYGVKWAREWLDLARYADSNGYEKDRDRSIWPYRDWVVNALNADMPYDQFTIEQLAGDMLPNATTDQRIATGFHRNTMLNEEGGIDPLEYRFHAMVDRVATTGLVWLGLTTGCAQCHTHKFDPITHTDYYALMGLLNNADEPEIEVPVADVVEKRKQVDAAIDELTEQHLVSIDEVHYQVWRAEKLIRSVSWITPETTAVKSSKPLLAVQSDGSIYASGDFTKRDVFTITVDASALKGKAITALRIEALPDDRLPAKGPGAAYYEGRRGDFFLSELKVTAGEKALKLSGASVSFGKLSVGSGKVSGVNILDGDGSTGWSTSGREGKVNELVVNVETPQVVNDTLEVEMLFERHFVAALGRFRISLTSDSGEAKAREEKVPNAKESGDPTMRLAYLQTEKKHNDFQSELAKLEKSRPALPTTLVMREWPKTNVRPTFRHHRGEYLQAKEKVAPAVPVAFDPIPDDEPKNRLGLARWLVSDRNPLVARVAVNRAWRSFFGVGLLKTSGDFGYQSEQPTNQALLDWLAVEFVEKGMSMKSLHKLIVTSDAYQRSSAADSILHEKDPENRLLARGPRFRLTGEMLRDGALQSAGLLSDKKGGPGVYPPQPDSVFDLAYGSAKWVPSTGENRYRRSLYTFTKRTAPFAAYLAFDGPTGESCIPRRDRSNTPLQALTLLNDKMFSEAAEELALLRERFEGQALSSARTNAITLIFRRILTRPPTKSDLGELLAFYQKQIERLGSDELKATEILSDAENLGGAADEMAALKMVARVLLNLNENITRG